MAEKNRLNLAISSRTVERLDKLQEHLDAASTSETIRRSVEFMAFIAKCHAEGGKLTLEGPDGQKTDLKVFF